MELGIGKDFGVMIMEYDRGEGLYCLLIFFFFLYIFSVGVGYLYGLLYQQR